MIYLGRELLILSPLAVYIFYRLMKLLAGKAPKIFLAIVFPLVLAGYPLAESLSHRPSLAGLKSVLILGYYTLPLLLYLAMTVVLVDLVVGAGRLFKIVSKDAVRGASFRRVRLGIVLVVPAAAVAFGIINFNSLRTQRATIEIPRRSSPAGELTIVFAADFHLGKLTSPRLMDKFVARANAEKPDLVLIGGDVLEGHRGDETAGSYAAAFRKLKATYGVYGAPGNHEGYGGNRDEFFAQAGITLLRDRVESIDGVCYLAGRNEAGRSRNRKSVAELLQDTPDDRPLILLEHRPTDLDETTRRRVDVKLSGHTHHGQFFPLQFIPQGDFELSWGYLKKGRTHFYVTSGVQLWGPPVRTVGASEFLVIRIKLI